MFIMTEKEKAKAYDEALERAKKLHDKIDIKEIFPELNESEDYRFNNESHYWPICYCDEECRLWTIQDVKDGDIICYRDEISLYKHDIKNCTKQETTFGGFIYYCCYDGKRFITDSFYLLTKQDEMDIHPATKEQRDLLLQKMKEAGYKWDTEKKELKKEKSKIKTIK